MGTQAWIFTQPVGSGNDSSYTCAAMYFSYADLANPGLEPHALNTYQSHNLMDDKHTKRKVVNELSKIFPPIWGMNILLPNWS